MTSWPILHTDPQAADGREIRIAIACAFWVWLGAALIGLALMLIGFGLQAVAQKGIASGFGGAAMILLYSPFFSWAGLIPAIPLAIWALRRGFGGWCTALGAGSIVGGFVLVLIARGDFGAFPIGGMFGGGFAALYWLIGRFAYPSAFASP